MLGHGERPVSHASPEVEILLCLLVLQRHIADDAERDERHAIDMACLRNGAALHVHRLCFGETVEYGAHLVTTVD